MQLIDGATGGVEQSPSGYPRDDCWVKLVPIPDVSGDDYEDVVNLRAEIGSSSGARALVLSGPTLEEIRRLEKSAVASDERMWDANHISDITFDGRPEMVIGWKDHVFLMSGANGTEIWNTTVTSGNTQYTRAHRITEGRDLSGDGVEDIAIGVENGQIHFLSGEDGSSVFDPYEISGSVNAIAYLEDVNGDSYPEVLVGGEDHYIYCLTVSVEKTPTEVYVKLTPNPIGIGEALTLKGILVNEYYQPLPNAIVELYARPLNGSWRHITSLTANTQGVLVWQATMPPVAGIYIFAVYYPGSERCEPTYSLTVLLIQ